MDLDQLRAQTPGCAHRNHLNNAGAALMSQSRILTGRDEYGSNTLAYLQVARRSGAEIVVVPNDGDGQIESLRAVVDENSRPVE
jgi:selenocysteine lyase/cysteine desulfurase